MALTLTLDLVQGKTKSWRFSWRQPDDSYADFRLWDVYSQVRAREARDSDLLLSLTELFTVGDDTSGDGKYLRLFIPGRLTAGLDQTLFRDTASWDVFLVNKGDPDIDELLVQGSVTFDKSTTDMEEVEA